MDDGKGFSDHQYSAIDCVAVYNTENDCLATIKVRDLITNRIS